MQSGKQKRAAIMLRRKEKRQEAKTVSLASWQRSRPAGSVPVDKRKLTTLSNYGEPDFARRGYYLDQAFTCCDCGTPQIWTASQQQWWYEIVQGHVNSFAKRCLACRCQRRLARNTPISKPLRGATPISATATTR